MPILLKILLNVGKVAVALFLFLHHSGRLREELTLEQFEWAESFRAEREAAARPLSRDAFEAAFSDQAEPLAVDAFWAMVFQRPYGGLGWRPTAVRECLAQMAEPGLAYIQRHCYHRLQELQEQSSSSTSGGHHHQRQQQHDLDFAQTTTTSAQQPRLRLELLLVYRCFLFDDDVGGSAPSTKDYELRNASVTAFKQERDNYILTFEHINSSTCSPYWLHDYDGFSQVDSPPVVIDREARSVAPLVSLATAAAAAAAAEQPAKSVLGMALLLKDDAADPGKLTPLAVEAASPAGPGPGAVCFLNNLQPGSGLISSRCANLVREKLPHLLGLYAAYRCFLQPHSFDLLNQSSASEEEDEYVIHAAKVRNMIPEGGEKEGGDKGGGVEEGDGGGDKRVIIYFELEQANSSSSNTNGSQPCQPSWERLQLLTKAAAAQDEEDGVAVANEL